ncbi:Proline-rich protein 23A [Camelus dromedarius]|uniref:Proline-rich protein 23A n=1 Tax=Camelus dromedarius TaxID=9838 RepID=A0A5N4EKN9_CAMDR|nr:Proline-rich protein 23A [Camelus dromedarius]
MGSRPRSPSAYSVDRWGPQAEGPGPAKRRRTNEPSDPESEAASSPDNLTRPRAADARTSVVVLDADCALYLPLDDVDLVLEPEATSVQRVSLRDHTVMVVPETLLASVTECLGGQGHSSLGLEQGALLSAPGEYIALEQGFFYGSVPEIAAQEEVYEEDVDAEFLPPGMEAAAGSNYFPIKSSICLSIPDLPQLFSAIVSPKLPLTPLSKSPHSGPLPFPNKPPKNPKCQLPLKIDPHAPGIQTTVEFRP